MGQTLAITDAGDLSLPFLLLLAALLVELMAAAYIDARERRFPNELAAALALTGVAMVYAWGGTDLLLANMGFAICACVFLVVFELVWRRTHGGNAGLGMGDVKFLAGYVIATGVFAVTSFALGLVLLAVAGTVSRERSYPLIPFIVCASAVLLPLMYAFAGA